MNTSMVGLRRLREVTFLLLFLLAPFLAAADALDIYGRLIGKTVLMPGNLPTLPDSPTSDLPGDKTNVVAAIEQALAGQGIAVVQDGPHFVRLVPARLRDSMTNAPLRGAELAPAEGQEAASKHPDALPEGMITFLGADLRQVLDIYSLMRQRTILRPATLPWTTVRLKTQGGLTMAEGIYALETVLALNGIALVDDGTTFVQAVPMHNRAQARTGAPKRAPGAKMMPAGLIDFRGAELNQVFSIYAVMSQRTILRPVTLPAPTVTLQSKSALSEQEALYAMAKVLELDGICLVEDGAKFVQAVPMAQRAQVKTKSPQPEPGAKVFDPGKVPALGSTRTVRPRNEMERLEQEFEKLGKAFYDFMHLTPPHQQSPQRLLELYARLADKTAVASTNFDRVSIFFRVETPLTRSELLYAIETTMSLHGLAIVPVDDRKIRLEEAPPASKRPAVPKPKARGLG